jgi:hypothetical protein
MSGPRYQQPHSITLDSLDNPALTEETICFEHRRQKYEAIRRYKTEKRRQVERGEED